MPPVIAALIMTFSMRGPFPRSVYPDVMVEVIPDRRKRQKT
jgi:hypothetical protein